MRSKIYFPEQVSETFEEVFSSFIISQTSKWVSAVTIRNYHSHLKGISKHLDITLRHPPQGPIRLYFISQGTQVGSRIFRKMQHHSGLEWCCAHRSVIVSA